uniref:Uncharacterized protein n=1 Tax=Paenarthrobacter aurescens TaxID=43663 RepID=Q6SK60_PAEAU|nr:hypothetical protein [Paenarthrobacter aurescens]
MVIRSGEGTASDPAFVFRMQLVVCTLASATARGAAGRTSLTASCWEVWLPGRVHQFQIVVEVAVFMRGKRPLAHGLPIVRCRKQDKPYPAACMASAVVSLGQLSVTVRSWWKAPGSGRKVPESQHRQGASLNEWAPAGPGGWDHS